MLLIIFKTNASKISFRNIIRVCLVAPDLGPNCLQRLSAHDTSRQKVKPILQESNKGFAKRPPVYPTSEQQRHRSACTSTKSGSVFYRLYRDVGPTRLDQMMILGLRSASWFIFYWEILNRKARTGLQTSKTFCD